MNKIIGVLIDGEASWHAANVGGGPDYATLCGIDPDDPGIGHMGTVEPTRGQKITCQECFSAWRCAIKLKLRQSDFDVIYED